MDTHTTSADLISVKNNIVSFCTDFSRISIKKRKILLHQHGKRMVHSCEAVLFLTPLKKWKLCYPYETVLIFIKKIHLFCKLKTKCSQYIVYKFSLVCCEKKQISRLTIHSFYKGIHFFVFHEFGKGRFSGSVFCNGNVCKTFCTISSYKFNKFVNFLSRHASLAFCVNTTNASAVFESTCEYTETAVFHNITDIMKFHAKPHIRFVRTETIHSFLPGDSLDRKFYINIQNFFKQECKISLININNIVYIYERKFHIDLRELRLTVSTKILISETSCDLDITVKSGAHQKLLVQLWRLRKSVEASRMNT